jgi:nucleoside-diphosphate-sugar epimerase
MVIPHFVASALAGQTLEVYGDGHQTRCFCHVLDAIRALRDLMAEPSASGEIFNVGSANRISMLDLAKLVIEVTRSNSQFAFVPYDKVYGTGIEDMLHRIPSIDKIAAAIGWNPELGLDSILSDVIDSLRPQSEGPRRADRGEAL